MTAYAIFRLADRDPRRRSRASRQSLRGHDRGLRGIGSYDLRRTIDHLADRIGKPSLVVCLIPAAAAMTSCGVRPRCAAAGGNLCRRARRGAYVPGDASGVIASSFRCARCLSRLEDEGTGRIVPEALHAEVPADRLEQAKAAATVLGNEVWDKFPVLQGMRPMNEDNAELVLNRTGDQPCR